MTRTLVVLILALATPALAGSVRCLTYASVSGGQQNTASGGASSVSGGEGNTASGDFSSVSGGRNRMAEWEFDWVADPLVADE